MPTGVPSGDQAAAGQADPQAQASQTSALMAKFGKMLGPAMVIGGAALAAYGLRGGVQNVRKLPVFTGAAMGASGLWATATGFKAQGRQDGVLETEAAVQTQVLPAIIQQAQAREAQYQQVIQQLEQQMAMQGVGGAGPGVMPGGALEFDPATGQPIDPAGLPIDPTTGQPVDPSAIAPGVPASGDGVSATEAPAIAPSQWTAAGLVGSALQLPEAKISSGAIVAEGGSYALTEVMGDANGYASFAEADQVARSTMSTSLMGTKLYRWAVIEHGGRYYAFQAQRDDTGTTPRMPQENGTLAGWHALRFVDAGNGSSKWMEYTWTPAGGTHKEFGGAMAPGASQSGSPSGSGGEVTGGGPSSSASDAVRPLIGTGFAVNDASFEGRAAAGGWLQLQAVVPGSARGFATPSEAASAARADRTASSERSQWQRWVTIKAQDGRYYAFQAQIVNRSTAPVSAGAQPIHVFGHGFAEYFDGSAWQVRPDS